MLPTSGTYNFQSVEVELLIREAFERIGIPAETLDLTKLESARRSINLLLLSWMDKTTNLWSIQSSLLALVPGQVSYQLPSNVLDIIQVNLRNSSRQTTTLGTAQTNTSDTYDNGGGGVAANAFDADSLTGCTQTVTNGNISYDFGITNPGPNQIINKKTITFIGVQSNVTRDYTLLIESCPNDPTILASWKTLLEIPEQTYTEGNIVWFEVNIPVNARAYRVREVGGEILSIREIYFNNNTIDYTISNISRNEYETRPNKFFQSRPNTYYLDRQVTPVLYIWPTASSQYNCLTYSYKRMLQDVKSLTETLEIPAKMYPTLIWGLAYHLAIKFQPDRADIMENKYNISFHEAILEDTEDVPITIKGDNNEWVS